MIMRLIDADALLETLGVTEGCNNCQYSVGKHCFRIGYSTITCKAIANAPTVLPQMEWIPCSERLPSEQDYKACYEAPNGIVWYCTSEGLIGLGWYYESTWEWANLNNEAIVGDVIAWMPLPEPCEENKE